jgi:hypothetical protein
MDEETLIQSIDKCKKANLKGFIFFAHEDTLAYTEGELILNGYYNFEKKVMYYEFYNKAIYRVTVNFT